MSPRERLSKIIELLESGRTVTFWTSTKGFRVTSRNYLNRKAQGEALFKATEKSLYLLRGMQWDCVDYCKVTVTVP